MRDRERIRKITLYAGVVRVVVRIDCAASAAMVDLGHRH
jgi:hypothetical protein